jgi:hypothetical protein
MKGRQGRPWTTFRGPPHACTRAWTFPASRPGSTLSSLSASIAGPGGPRDAVGETPCSNVGTLQLIETAVTRRCSVDGSVVSPEWAVPATEARKAVTVYARDRSACRTGWAH